MVAPSETPLGGKRILVPPARPEANPLLRMLERKGAEVVEFPALVAAPPGDYGPVDEAIRKLEDFDWIVFSGSNCVANFFQRLNRLGFGKEVVTGAKVAAIGHGALSALKKEGIEVDYVPKVHTAEGVTGGFQEISGLRFLLVRIEAASRDLPETLKDLGAKVSEVAGYRMLVEANKELAERAFGGNLHCLALANPTAVRFLVKATDAAGIDLRDRIKRVTIAAVGPATAEAAKRQGLAPQIVSKGHIADLAESLTHFFGK